MGETTARLVGAVQIIGGGLNRGQACIDVLLSSESCEFWGQYT